MVFVPEKANPAAFITHDVMVFDREETQQWLGSRLDWWTAKHAFDNKAQWLPGEWLEYPCGVVFYAKDYPFHKNAT